MKRHGTPTPPGQPPATPARPLEVLGMFITFAGGLAAIASYIAGDTEKTLGSMAVMAFGALVWLLMYITFLLKNRPGA